VTEKFITITLSENQAREIHDLIYHKVGSMRDYQCLTEDEKRKMRARRGTLQRIDNKIVKRLMGNMLDERENLS